MLLTAANKARALVHVLLNPKEPHIITSEFADVALHAGARGADVRGRCFAKLAIPAGPDVTSIVDNVPKNPY